MKTLKFLKTKPFGGEMRVPDDHAIPKQVQHDKISRQRCNIPLCSPAFTLAEVLITLTIIGIVAAMTVPSLLVNVNEKAWDAQRKALHARLAQALAMLPRLNNYGTFTYETTEDEEGNSTTTISADTAAETFVTTALSSVYKIVNVCASTDGGDPDLSACGLPDSITALGGTGTISPFPVDVNDFNSQILSTTGSTLGDFSSPINTKAVGLETANGESIALYYNPECEADSTASHFAQNKICVNFVYDLNGSKGPNEVGKDIGFITALYRNDPVVVAPMPYSSNAGSAKWEAASALCKDQDEDYRLPDRDEVAAMFYNCRLIQGVTNGGCTGYFWSGSVISAGSSGLAWYQNFNCGGRHRNSRSSSHDVRCVRK